MEPDNNRIPNGIPNSSSNSTVNQPTDVKRSSDNFGIITIILLIVIAVLALYFFYRPHLTPIHSNTTHPTPATATEKSQALSSKPMQ